jgi:hypothetical protein
MPEWTCIGVLAGLVVTYFISAITGKAWPFDVWLHKHYYKIKRNIPENGSEWGEFRYHYKWGIYILKVCDCGHMLAEYHTPEEVHKLNPEWVMANYFKGMEF